MRSVAAVVALAACLHAAAWAYFQPRSQAPDIEGPLASVSYTPFEGISRTEDRGMVGKFVNRLVRTVDNRPKTDGVASSDEDAVRKVLSPDDPAYRKVRDQIRNDLRAIAPYTNTVRTYESTMGEELVPGIAAEFGLRVTVGIWLSGCTAKTTKDECDAIEKSNENEIRSAVDLARRHSNVNAVVVGNETTLRREKTVDELVTLIKRVKKQVSVPVTTGETWDVWLEHQPDPQKDPDYKYKDGYKLASAVDFIAAHILPYWDKKTPAEAVDHTIEVYNQLRRAHVGKHIVIAEFGYPSAGYNRDSAEPGRAEQAMVIRNFASRARALGIDYNVIEAYDQPWKVKEGSVGSYWGLFDATRAPKFNWTGPITDANHTKLAAIAVAAGLLVSLPILAIAGATLGQVLLLAFASHVVGAWAATAFDFWNGHYFVPGSAFAFFVGMLLLIPLVMIALARIQEIATILFGAAPRRLLPLGLHGPETFVPKVSIHIPAHMEPAEMLKATLDSVARLEYPNFECIVILNNTPDPTYWEPIEAHCRALGGRFKFLNINGLAGFKAGALRLALEHAAADAEIIGVMDADYVAHPNWLKDLVPVFSDPKVGLIQAPQDHRDDARSVMHYAMNGEYAGFFDIGMVQRNEANAIVVHGTMCLVRRAALTEAGGWSSDTICEDTDLGLTILEHGWAAHYTNRRYGHGLLPDSFEAYKKQRHRWAYGGVQIVRKHWGRLLPGTGQLARDQRREFAMGWLNWLGAESLGVVVAILNLIWVPVVAFVGIAIPDKILTLPILAAFVVSVLHFVTLYRARVAITPTQAAAAMIAAMSMQWTVARAVGFGLIKDHLPFVRTAKGGAARKRVAFPAFNEAILAGLLVLGAAIVFATNYQNVREVSLFGWVLLVQSIPFIAAVALAALEESRFNSFVFWRQLETRLAWRRFQSQPVQSSPLGSSLNSPLNSPLSTPTISAPALAEATIMESVQTTETRMDVLQ
jgi:exo-beta-1,3-glucanase (GH17 family)/cellulose synthase/poly-beta-1,6-N-acetylglucosamine synthase-like glycosyltransferase